MDIVKLSVDYSRSLKAMIAAGHYDWKYGDIIAKYFPVKGEGVEQFEANVFHFDRGISSEKTVEEIKAAGWEPSKIEHLLAFGEKYPEEQRKHPIIALGSVGLVNGYPSVSCLHRRGAGRYLRVFWWGFDWDGRFRFLAVRSVKISGSSAAVV